MVKVSSELNQKVAKAKKLGGPQEIDVLIEFYQFQPASSRRFIAEKFKGKIKYVSKIKPYMSMKVDASQVEALAASPNVKMVWHVPKFQLLGNPTIIDAQKHLNIDALKEAGYTGSGVKIGILDTGIDETHPMFNGTRIIAQQTFLEGGGMDDPYSHGTWVTSCIAGQHWIDPVSGREFEGIAPNAEVVIAKIFGQYGGSGATDTIMAALEWVGGFGVHICSNSWGGVDNYAPMHLLIQELMSMYGTIFVFACGNAGPQMGTILYPAGWNDVVAVGSVGIKEPYPNAVAPFSSRGPVGTLTKPDIMAPGGTKLASGPAPGEETVCAAGLNQGVKCLGGTSMACPSIAGGLALMVQAGTPNPVTRLYETATDIVFVGKDDHSGYGVANFAKASDLLPVDPCLLTIEANLPNVEILVDNGIYAAPLSQHFSKGEHVLEVLTPVVRGRLIYEFAEWSDGETSRIRTLRLDGDASLTCLYRKLNAFIIPLLEYAVIDQQFPDQNRDHKFMPLPTTRSATHDGKNYSLRTLFKFDLSFLLEALNLTSAKLFLHLEDLRFDGYAAPPRQIGLHAVAHDEWKLDTATWNNQPALAELLDSVVVEEPPWEGKWYPWDVTAVVRSEYLGDKILSLCLKDDNENDIEGRDFLARFSLGGFAPYLIVEFAAPQHVLTVDSQPLKVPVTLDGLKYESTPLQVAISEGEHAISVPEEVET